MADNTWHRTLCGIGVSEWDGKGGDPAPRDCGQCADAPQPAASEAALLCAFLDWLLDDDGNERDWFFKRYGLSIGERSNIRIAKRFLAARAAAGGRDE